MKINALLEPVQVTTDVANFAAEPVTLDEVKRHLNLLFDTSGSFVFDDDDTYLTDLVSECRESLEQELYVALAVKSYKAILCNECGDIEIPYGPISGTPVVKDKDGTTLTSTTGLTLRGNQFKWIECPRFDYLEVTYTSGYTSTTIPKGLKRALLEEIAYRYSNRGDEKEYSGICAGAAKLAGPYSRKSVLV